MSANVLGVPKSSAGRDWQCPSFQSGKIFCFNIQQLRPAGRSCWMLKQKIFPGFFKKNSHATWQASNSCSPLQPLLQSCNWKGVNVPNMNGFFLKADGDNPKETTLKLGGTGGSHAWIYSSIGWLFFMKNTDWNEGHCQSLPALLLVRPGHWLTLGQKMQNIMVAIWITNWTKEVSLVFVTGAAIWHACCSFAWQVLGFGSTMPVLRGPAMQLTCNTRNTQSTQHATRARFL